MSRLRWSIEHSLWGWQGIAALPLLAVAVLLQLALVPQLQERVDARTAAAAAASVRKPQRLNDDPGRQLQEFYRHFATGDALPEHLATLHGVAQAHGIALNAGEYRLLRDRDAKLTRYQVTLPVQGSYPDVRRFVAAALQSLPLAALDHVSFERKRIGDGNIEAQVQFTLYLPAT